MSLKPYQEKIIQQMIDQERLMSGLYRLFAEEFPQHSEFWTNLSEEEKKHSGFVEKLGEAGKKGLVLFDEGKTKSYTLSTFITHLEKQCERARNKEFNIKTAFSCALDFEKSLIEKDVFSRFDSLSERTFSIMNKLKSETEQHIEKIRQRLNEIPDNQNK